MVAWLPHPGLNEAPWLLAMRDAMYQYVFFQTQEPRCAQVIPYWGVLGL